MLVLLCMVDVDLVLKSMHFVKWMSLTEGITVCVVIVGLHACHSRLRPRSCHSLSRSRPATQALEQLVLLRGYTLGQHTNA